jgi:heptosyltransferase-2
VDGASRGAAEALWGGAARPRVVLQPGATYGPAKRWPADRFAAVARGLADRGVHVAVAGGPGDAQAVDAVRERAPFVMSFLGRTTVPVLAAVLESADAVVTNDTGPMHLAAAVGTRTVAVFGSTSPEWTGPLGRGHGVVREPVPCAPCFRRDCRIGYLCFLGVSAERVLAEVLRTLEGETG